MPGLRPSLWLGGPLLGAGIMLALAPGAAADEASLFQPLRPLSRADLQRREARIQYGLAILRQQEDRLVEATNLLESARRLDPEAPAIHRALIPLYLALGRTDDALRTCQKVVTLDPGDFDTWYLYARQLRHQGQITEARTALTRALGCAELDAAPDQRVHVLFDLGVLHEEAQDLPAAIRTFQQVVALLDKPELLLEHGSFKREQIDEQAAKTWERLGRLCTQSQRYEEALAAFHKAQRTWQALATGATPAEPASAGLAQAQARRLSLNLAEVYRARGKPAEALRWVDDYLQTQPQGTEAYQLKLAILRQLGHGDTEVLRALRAHAERDSHNAALQLLLADELARAGETESAEEQYRAVAKRLPSPEVYRGWFRLYHTQGRMDTVLTLLNDAVRASKDGGAESATQARAMLVVLRSEAALVKALLPEAQKALLGHPPLAWEVRQLLAVLAARNRLLDDAEQLYRSCLDEGPIGFQTEATIYASLLRVLFEAKKYEEVVRVCEQGLRRTRRTNLALFHYDLSRALVLLGRSEEALAHADKAVALAQTDQRLGARLNRVRVLSQADRHEAAITECQALLQEFRLPGEEQEIRHVLSHVFAQKRDYERAEEQLRLILKADPNDATANNDLGYFWADQGKNLEEAERLIRKAIELDRQNKKTAKMVGADDDRDNAAFLDSLGWVLFRRGRVEEARSWLEKAATLPGGDDDPVVSDHLGDVYFRLEQPLRAQTAWRKALQQYTSDRRRKADDRLEDLKRKLEMLEQPTRQP